MEEKYIGKNSDYLQQTRTWHEEDSPWKALQIYNILQKNSITPKSIVDLGCGVGEILIQLDSKYASDEIKYVGYDIAKDAINIANKKSKFNIHFKLGNALSEDNNYDVLLAIDVFEHVEDYIGFIQSCKSIATFKIFHIPLDISISSLLRNRMIDARQSVGHLHYFYKDTAIATLNDCGLEIVDYFYTHGAIEKSNTSIKTKFANIFRSIFFKLNQDLTVKIFGGYSLIVLSK